MSGMLVDFAILLISYLDCCDMQETKLVAALVVD
jgi:hypothetical protein